MIAFGVPINQAFAGEALERFGHRRGLPYPRDRKELADFIITVPSVSVDLPLSVSEFGLILVRLVSYNKTRAFAGYLVILPRLYGTGFSVET